ncbi:phosphodiesterase [Sphingomonas histidinilytica]|jgi:3',5'-cyclic AMP phosphodiesterase CpdA|uniref:3',5'-cyclic AMP phosphodiesterase CpdA n=1 Tax=Rhizorhabdus histidinilytica TaxID=439228 RepID=A0A1T5F5T5_9SPHN|nr:metallophosphoesterase [Rhizorhabdus histidinilytica]MBO9379570.1 phosphodiesterase [Rhizorhabdus histidinilytica]QEH77989.1 phosphodiesterase [Sphingomonas sp. C8-2]SKB91480.1 3',5'-cyclic AMP phosphodiesterase CpdA [Rhizorhabdus histidinilytica]
MLIAQLTDLHIGFDLENPDELNFHRVAAAIDYVKGLSVVPDRLFLTGDLTDHGDVASYERLKGLVDGCGFPVHLCVGNHDDRAAMKQVFPDLPVEDGFVQYVIDEPEVRIIVLDTLDPGHHGGAFGHRRAGWLKARLAEVPGKPVLIVLHHPPIETGIPWMTAHQTEPWVVMLDKAIGDRPDVTMISGHIHRSITTRWHGRMLAVAPSTAPQVALEMAPIDPQRPDERPMIVAEQPGVALHLWTGEGFVTHHAQVGAPDVLARYDRRLQPLVQALAEEHDTVRPGAAAA